MMPFRRKISNLSVEEIAALTEDDLNLPLTQVDFDEALQKVSKSVSAADLEKYKQWMDEFGST